MISETTKFSRNYIETPLVKTENMVSTDDILLNDISLKKTLFDEEGINIVDVVSILGIGNFNSRSPEMIHAFGFLCENYTGQKLSKITIRRQNGDNNTIAETFNNDVWLAAICYDKNNNVIDTFYSIEPNRQTTTDYSTSWSFNPILIKSLYHHIEIRIALSEGGVNLRPSSQSQRIRSSSISTSNGKFYIDGWYTINQANVKENFTTDFVAEFISRFSSFSNHIDDINIHINDEQKEKLDKINVLNSNLITLEETVEELTADLSTLSDNVNELVENSETISENFDSLNDDLSSLSERLDNTDTNLNKHIIETKKIFIPENENQSNGKANVKCIDLGQSWMPSGVINKITIERPAGGNNNDFGSFYMALQFFKEGESTTINDCKSLEETYFSISPKEIVGNPTTPRYEYDFDNIFIPNDTKYVRITLCESNNVVQTSENTKLLRVNLYTNKSDAKVYYNNSFKNEGIQIEITYNKIYSHIKDDNIHITSNFKNEIENRISEAEDYIQNNLNHIIGDVDLIEENISALEENISTLEENISSMEENISTMEDSISKIETSNSDIQSLNDEVVRSSTTISKIINESNDNIDKLSYNLKRAHPVLEKTVVNDKGDTNEMANVLCVDMSHKSLPCGNISKIEIDIPTSNNNSHHGTFYMALQFFKEGESRTIDDHKSLEETYFSSKAITIDSSSTKYVFDFNNVFIPTDTKYTRITLCDSNKVIQTEDNLKYLRLYICNYQENSIDSEIYINGLFKKGILNSKITYLESSSHFSSNDRKNFNFLNEFFKKDIETSHTFTTLNEGDGTKAEKCHGFTLGNIHINSGKIKNISIPYENAPDDCHGTFYLAAQVYKKDELDDANNYKSKEETIYSLNSYTINANNKDSGSYFFEFENLIIPNDFNYVKFIPVISKEVLPISHTITNCKKMFIRSITKNGEVVTCSKDRCTNIIGTNGKTQPYITACNVLYEESIKNIQSSVVSSPKWRVEIGNINTTYLNEMYNTLTSGTETEVEISSQTLSIYNPSTSSSETSKNVYYLDIDFKRRCDVYDVSKFFIGIQFENERYPKIYPIFN